MNILVAQNSAELDLWMLELGENEREASSDRYKPGCAGQKVQV